uniref:cytochrome d ubiquinol oxidase subunit II n=1 Tax=Phycicoccus sp. TaxID=1902410 RepID=UPI002BC2B3AA
LTAGGATFAAFPEWYATMFSAFYLPLLLVLVALIVRNMGFEYRGKRDDATWRKRWDLAIIGGSVVAPFLVGVALTNVVRGVPINGDMEYVGNLFTLLNPLSLLGGLTVLALSLTHGAFFLALKTSGSIREDARRMGTVLGLVTAGLAVVTLLWLNLSTGSVWSWVTTVVAAVALLAAIYANTLAREGWAFIGTAVTAAAAVATYFLALYPDVMPTTLAGGQSLTIENASSSPLTLKIMTGAALVFTPIVLIYTAYTYYTFRKRIGTQHIPAPVAVK